MKITLQLVVEAINHCSDKQEADLIFNLKNNTEAWAGIVLGEIIAEHMESMEEGEESDRAEEFRENKLHLPARNLA
tara:strand:+ start:4616 stop:4843 length:228 start_codon:yes stop_codon:yes gene_type:complete